MGNAWCSVVTALLQTTRNSPATQETSKMAQGDLTHLYDNYCRREISLSCWHEGGQKEARCSHPNHAHPLFNAPERRACGDPFGLVINTNIALTTTAPNQPKWGVWKPCQSLTLRVQYRRYFKLLYEPLTFTCWCNIILGSYSGNYNLCPHQILGLQIFTQY